MLAVRSVYLSVFLCGLVPFAAAQTQTEYPLCQVPLAIGEIPDRPFTATMVEDAWKIAPDGTKQPIELPDAKTVHIARDSKGRVVATRSKVKVSHKSNGIADADQEVSEITICDPAANTTTLSTYSDRFSRGIDSATGQEKYFPAGIGGFGVAQSQTNNHTTSTFQAFHRTVKGRTALGPETFDGFPAYRYRFDVGRGLHEIVNADDLSVQLAQIVWTEDHDGFRETKLSNLRFQEPPQNFFNIPEGVVVHVAGQRHVQ